MIQTNVAVKRTAQFPALRHRELHHHSVYPNSHKIFHSALSRRQPASQFLLKQRARARCVFKVFSKIEQDTAAGPGPAPPPDDPKYWVKVDVSDSVMVPVSEFCDPGAELEKYMKLPVSQYTLIELPLGGRLSRLNEHMFELKVPRVEIFSLWVEPQLVCQVSQETQPYQCVQVVSNDCRVDGTGSIPQLTECFHFYVKSYITWRNAEPDAYGVPQQPALICNSQIRVRLDPPLPFSVFPKELLEATGNAVMGASLKSLQGSFIKNLAKDYAKWATSADYRTTRSLVK